MLEVIVLVGMGVFLYGDSVRLPFFSDDIVHNWWVEGNSFLDLWRFSTALGHYRPLPFVMWKVSLWLTGSLHAPLLLPTDYRIAVGVYDLESGRRLPALSAEGRRFENDAVPVGR